MPTGFAFPFRSLAACCSRRAALFTLLALFCSGLLPSPAARADARAALPPAAGGFKMKGKVVVYTPATLENHIDGEAEAVKRYDFRQCAYAEYAPNGQGNQLITVDIFQMGSPLDAYGYYAKQRNARARFLKIGAEGYQEPTALNFWKGPYYVRLAITASHAPPAFQQAMPKIAQAVAAKLTGSTGLPPMVNLLPPNHAPRTEQYIRSNIAAQSYIGNGVVARYPSAGPQAELFIAAFSTPAAAKQAYSRYQAYLTTPANVAIGAKPAPLKGIGDSALGVRSKFTGEVAIAVKGKYLVGVRKAKDAASAQNLLKAAVARVK
ncbi:MAG TPA: DUF6599 family protein [Chthonomonadaceae bacterium]|nr:DUF6599 family protein [Chthonomonadaceae bacterium]